uniref:Carboxylic ester hydrolase n=1 Tax=Culicoides sonorensis TaxID=179676 RepID=A0A336MV40_CULSO
MKSSVITLFFLLVISLNVEISYQLEQLTPVIETSNGLVQGRVLLSASNNIYFAFQGIRYAKPPVNELRFEPPVPIGNWSDIFNATKDGPHCPQGVRDDLNIEISEDCLHLNIYSRPSLTSQLRPVLVYIHGGGFNEGSNTFEHDVGPQYIMDHEIIFVAINYRLNIFGFISTGTKSASGSLGLKDQILALKWIKNNIRYFGGNPNSITLMGESAGAMSVSLLMASSQSENLFQRAILSSGSAIAHWKLPNNLLDITRKSAQMVGCNTNDTNTMIKCLKTVDFKLLAKTYQNLKEWHSCPIRTWMPVIEEDFVQERVLVEDPVLTFRRGDMAKVDVMIGIMRDEWAFTPVDIIKNETLLYEFDTNFDVIAPICFNYERNTSKSLTISHTLRNRTFGENVKITNDSFNGIHTLFSEAVVNFGVYRIIQLLSLQTDLNIYAYHFSYQGRYSHVYYPDPDTPFGVVHADDLFYLFVQNDKVPPFNQTDPEWEFVHKYIKLIVNFAEFSNPNPNQDLNVTWTTLTPESPIYLDFNTNMVMKNDLPWDRIKMWNELFPLSIEPEISEKNSLKWVLITGLCLGFIAFALLLILILRHFNSKRTSKEEIRET